MNISSHWNGVIAGQASKRLVKRMALASLFVLPTTALNAFTEGEGTEDDPFIVTSSDSTLDVSSYYLANRSINFGTTPFYVGYKTTDNFLTISGSGVTVEDDDAYIGYQTGSMGSVTVTDGAAWNSSYVYIGQNGKGTLTVKGSGSRLTGNISIGSIGSGTLNILSGGITNSPSFCYIGGGDSSTNGELTGAATVSGANSSWTVLENLCIGYRNAGTLNIENGGCVSDISGLISCFYWSSGSSVTVAGHNSAWLNSDLLVVGDDYDDASLYINDGGLVTCDDCYIGQGSNNSLAIVSGDDSSLACSGDLAISYLYGSSNALLVNNGGKVINVKGYVGRANSSGIVTINGADSSWTNSGILYIGYDSSSGTLRIENGASVSCVGSNIGSDRYDHNNGNYADCLSLIGEGSLFHDSGALSLGVGTTSEINLCDGSMLVTDSSPTIGDYGAIYFSGGCWAVSGKTTAKAAVAGYNIKVFNGSEWVAATASDLTATYYDGTSNIWADSALYSAFGSKIDLTGYTIITGGSSYLGWSDCGAPVDGWNNSSWYGWLYADTSFGNWIYQGNHGWQYVWDAGDHGAYVYDSATGDWWFTSKSFYPYIYDYSVSGWLFYHDGATPDREFWDYNSGSLIGESSL